MRNDLFDQRLFHIPGEQIELRLIGTYEGKDGGLPYYWWDIILKSDCIPIGKISFRIGHNYHSYYNGNIGYEIDEAFRGHHYALLACQLVLQAAQFHNMSKIYLTCDYDNAASYKTIEKLGSTLIEEVRPPEDYLYYHKGIAVHKIYELSISR